jgi:hypothetical protein
VMRPWAVVVPGGVIRWQPVGKVVDTASKPMALATIRLHKVDMEHRQFRILRDLSTFSTADSTHCSDARIRGFSDIVNLTRNDVAPPFGVDPQEYLR